MDKLFASIIAFVIVASIVVAGIATLMYKKYQKKVVELTIRNDSLQTIINQYDSIQQYKDSCNYELIKQILIEDIKRREGFRAYPYLGTDNRYYIGYGTNCISQSEPITEYQAEQTLIHIFDNHLELLKNVYLYKDSIIFNKYELLALTALSYQVGFNKVVNNFKDSTNKFHLYIYFWYNGKKKTTESIKFSRKIESLIFELQ